jgi:hypothetical protein
MSGEALLFRMMGTAQRELTLSLEERRRGGRSDVRVHHVGGSAGVWRSLSIEGGAWGRIFGDMDRAVVKLAAAEARVWMQCDACGARLERRV